MLRGKKTITLNEYYNNSVLLIAKIQELARKYSSIVTINRDSMFLASLVATALNIRKVSYMDISVDFNEDFSTLDGVTMNVRLDGKAIESPVLYVVDLINTGQTVNQGLREINHIDPAAKIDIATIFYNKESIVSPDYYLYSNNSWIVLPWHSRADNIVVSDSLSGNRAASFESYSY